MSEPALKFDELVESSEFSLAEEAAFAAAIDEVASSLTLSGGRGQLAKWLTENTSHPSDPTINWSFAEHEYQLGILNCLNPEIVVKKAAQVGVSELSLRIGLAMTQLGGLINVIYVLPTTGFARKFAVSRIDPVINNSHRLKSLLNRDVNNSEMKQLGGSFLFIGGAQRTSQAISIPAKVLIRDEFDFCDQATLTSYQSRLGHNKIGEASQWDFSTPTSPGYGIAKRYELGTQHHYLCFHDTCGKWTVVDPLEDVVVPGFDNHLTEMLPQDLQSDTLNVKGAKLLCQQCRHEISQANLCDASKRAWVPRYPDREVASFQVSPLDVPSVNSPAKLIRARELYKTTADWINFSFGMEYESSENSILDSMLDKAFQVPRIFPTEGGVYGTALGMDIGKVSHMVVGKRVDGVLNIIWMEKIRQTMEDATTETYVNRHKQYGSLRGVIDAAPDVTIPGRVRSLLPYNQAWGAYFVRGKGKADLELYTPKEGEGVVNIARTRLIDEMVKDFNAGRILLPRGMDEADVEEVKRHMKAVKRVSPRESLEGADTAFWSSSGADHWFLAICYLYVAADMLAKDSTVIVLPSVKSLVTKVALKQ